MLLGRDSTLFGPLLSRRATAPTAWMVAVCQAAGPSVQRSADRELRLEPDNDGVFSDEEEEAAAIDADGEGVWDHAFCVVCDCLIETEPPQRDKSQLDDASLAAATVSSLRRHGIKAQKPFVQPPSYSRRAPLFCSERCRRQDQERSEHLEEFMNYVSLSPAQPPSTLRASSLRIERLPQPLKASPRATEHDENVAAKSLNMALFRAETRAGMTPMSPEGSPSRNEMLFPRRKTMHRQPQAPTDVSPTAPSNLTRGRANNARRSSSLAASAPPTAALLSRACATSPAELFVESPPASVVFGEGTTGRVSRESSVLHSPLDLLDGAHVPRAEPSVSVVSDSSSHSEAPTPGILARLWSNTSAAAAAAAVAAAGRAPRHTATDSLRHAQRFADSSALPRDTDARQRHAMRHARSRYVPPGRTVVPLVVPRDGRRSSATSSLHVPSVASSRGSDHGSSSEVSPSYSERRRGRRGREMHVLPPLLGPTRAQTPSPAPRRSQSAVRGGPFSMPRHSSNMWVGSLPASSLQRSGLGWSALAPLAVHEQQDGSDEEREEARARYNRSRSHERRHDEKMYPLLQLPDTNVHDTYSRYWQHPAMSRSPATSSSTSLDASSHRRKHLFHFDG